MQLQSLLTPVPLNLHREGKLMPMVPLLDDQAGGYLGQEGPRKNVA